MTDDDSPTVCIFCSPPQPFNSERSRVMHYQQVHAPGFNELTPIATFGALFHCTLCGWETIDHDSLRDHLTQLHKVTEHGASVFGQALEDDYITTASPKCKHGRHLCNECEW